MTIREVREKIFNTWDEYFIWNATVNKDNRIRVCGLKEADNNKISANYIELF